MASEGGALRELIAFLGFQVDDAGLKKGEESLNGLLEKAKRAGEALVVALGIEKIGEWIHSQIEMGAQLEHTSQMLGIGTDELQAFQYAAATVGISADEASNALGFLNRAIGNANTGNADAAATFAKLGVKLKDANGQARPIADLLPELADGFAKTSDYGIKTKVAMELFGRAGRGMIPLLNKGGAGVAALAEEFRDLGGGMSEYFVHDAEEAEHQLVRFKFAGQGLEHSLAAGLLPVVTDLAEWAVGIVKTFREWTTGTNIVRNTIIALTAAGVAAAIVWGILNIEIFAVVAALALLAIAVDDVITFFEGGDSVLGRFLDSIYGVGASKTIAKDLKDAWHTFTDALGELWDVVKNDLAPALGDLFKTLRGDNKGSLDDARSGIKGMADDAKDLVHNLADATREIASFIRKVDEFVKAHPGIAHAVQRHVGAALKGNVGVTGALSSLYGDINETYTGKSEYDEATPTVQVPNASIPGTIDLGGVNQNHHTEITIYGPKNPRETATAVTDVLYGVQVDANNAAFAAIPKGG